MFEGTRKYWISRYIFGTIGLIGLGGVMFNFSRGDCFMKENLPYLFMLSSGLAFGTKIKNIQQLDYNSQIYDLKEDYLKKQKELNEIKFVSNEALNQISTENKYSKIDLIHYSFLGKDISTKLKGEIRNER